ISHGHDFGLEQSTLALLLPSSASSLTKSSLAETPALSLTSVAVLPALRRRIAVESRDDIGHFRRIPVLQPEDARVRDVGDALVDPANDLRDLLERFRRRRYDKRIALIIRYSDHTRGCLSSFTRTRW